MNRDLIAKPEFAFCRGLSHAWDQSQSPTVNPRIATFHLVCVHGCGAEKTFSISRVSGMVEYAKITYPAQYVNRGLGKELGRKVRKRDYRLEYVRGLGSRPVVLPSRHKRRKGA